MSVIKRIFGSLFGENEKKSSGGKIPGENYSVRSIDVQKKADSVNKKADNKALTQKTPKKKAAKKSAVKKSSAAVPVNLKPDFESLKILLKENKCAQGAEAAEKIVSQCLKLIFTNKYGKNPGCGNEAMILRLESDKALTKSEADNFKTLYSAISSLGRSDEISVTTAQKILSRIGNCMKCCEESKSSGKKKNAAGTKRTSGKQPASGSEADKNSGNKAERALKEIKSDFIEAKKYVSRKGREKEPGIRIYRKIFKECIVLLCLQKCPAAVCESEKKMINRLIDSGTLRTKLANLLTVLYDALMNNPKKADYSNENLKEIRARIATLISVVQNLTPVEAAPVKKEKAMERPTEKAAEKTASKPEKAAVIPFKKMKKYAIETGTDLRKKFPDLYDYLAKAQSGYEEDDFKRCLHELRNALEVIVKYLCHKYAITDCKNLIDRIDNLEKYGDFSAGQVNVLHSVRKLGNLGSHHGANPQKSDAKEALSDFEKVRKLFETIAGASLIKINEPMKKSDYYSPSRKYYGRWSRCHTYQDMALKDEYNELKTKADSGDIEAMLDLASGFLEENILWSPVSLVCLKENNRYLDSYDVRYYYWITRACLCAYSTWKSGKPVPLRYLATALMEALKFAVYHDMHLLYTVDSKEAGMNTQYTYAESYLFGALKVNKEQFADMLIALMKEFNSPDIVSAVHRERTVKHVKFLMYLSYLSTTKPLGSSRYDSLNIIPEKIPKKYAISPEDTGKMAEEVIQKYKGDGFDINILHWDSIRKNYLERLNPLNASSFKGMSPVEYRKGCREKPNNRC